MSTDLPARRTTSTAGEPSALGSLRRLLKASGLIWAFLLLCVVATLISPHFLQTANLINVLRQIAMFGTISVGMTFVILTKGIDLSVGSLVGVVAVSTALMLGAGLPIPLAVVVALVLGVLLGAVNGLGVTLGNVPPFIMTLGMMVMARGAAMTLAGGQPVYLGDQANAFYWLGGGEMLGIPVPVWVFAAVALAAFYALRHTPYGRNIYAVGSNAEAARLSGINVGLVVFSVYVISGCLSALTALIFVSRLTVGEPTAGMGLELEAIAITVIGGTSLFGGEGGVGGTIIGAAILSVLANILNLTGVSPFTQQIVKGAIIVGAVLFETVRRRR
jgi:ribose transport system permease protein